MSKFFENESQQQEAFINILRSYSIEMVQSSFTGSRTDGDLYVNGRRSMILEVKSEVGSIGAEPYCQAILYYARASTDEVEKAFIQDVHFNFPCLIVTLFGWFCCKSASPSADETLQALTSVSLAQFGPTAPITKSLPPF